MNMTVQNYRFGTRSRREMEGMHPDLMRVFEMAIAITTQDFSIHDGHRTAQEQNQLFQRGASTLDGYERISKHQVQSDGYVHAGDLVPWRDRDGDGDSEFDWSWPHIYPIAEAVIFSAKTLNVQIRWGGCWRHVNPLTAPPEQLVQDYVRRKQKQGRRAFNDGPHWELFGYV